MARIEARAPARTKRLEIEHLAVSQFVRRPEQYVAITLPRPLSTTDLWKPRPGGGIMKTPAYKAWISECGYALLTQRPGRIDGTYSIKITVQDGLKIDLGNVEKSCSDLLEHHGVIENDRLCRRLECEWSAKVVGVHILLIAMKRGST